jgi:hypothetical protein
MALYGYARVSHVSQSLDVRSTRCAQRVAQSSAPRRKAAPPRKVVLNYRPCSTSSERDTVCVTRVDGIARSIADLQDILRVLSEHPTDRKFVQWFDGGGWFVTMLRNVRLSDVRDGDG